MSATTCQDDARPIPGERWTDLPDVCGAIANVRGGVICCGKALSHPGQHLDSSWGRYWSDETPV